jgi:endonuclease/exonuclease/phosphatase (EEP) superfamily protein YafD
MGDSIWWLALVNSFRYWLFIPAVFFWIDQLWNGIEQWAGIFLVLLTGVWIYFYAFTPLMNFIDKADKSLAPDFKVMTMNILYKNQGVNGVASIINKEQPDVVALQETTKRSLEELVKILAAYPYRNFKSPTNVTGVDVFSKYPISKPQVIPTEFGQAVYVEIQHPKKKINLINIHTESIDPLDVFGDTNKILHAYKGREQMLTSIKIFLSQAGLSPESLILLGDFNSTEGNYLYRQIADLQLQDSYYSINPIFFNGFTFPNNMLGLVNKPGSFVPLIRIDYIYHGKGFKTVKSKVSDEFSGSDHRPVISEIAIL